MKTPAVTIPTELHMAFVRLLDTIPPVLEDWIKTTGFGQINGRDKAALLDVRRAKQLQHEWLAESGILVE